MFVKLVDFLRKSTIRKFYNLVIVEFSIFLIVEIVEFIFKKILQKIFYKKILQNNSTTKLVIGTNYQQGCRILVGNWYQLPTMGVGNWYQLPTWL